MRNLPDAFSVLSHRSVSSSIAILSPSIVEWSGVATGDTTRRDPEISKAKVGTMNAIFDGVMHRARKLTIQGPRTIVMFEDCSNLSARSASVQAATTELNT